MFYKLLKNQEKKIELLQRQSSIINKNILITKENINSLKNNTINGNISSNNFGFFMASSMHHKTIKENIRQETIILNNYLNQLQSLQQKIKDENITLEKYKYIIEEEKNKKIKLQLRKESLEIDDFMQRHKPNF